MNEHPQLEGWLNWLVNHSLQAGVLVLLVLAVQWLFRRRMASRWRFALWWIVLVRLLLPFNPQSVVSVFNVLQPSVRVAGPRYYLPPVVPRPEASVAVVQNPPVEENVAVSAPVVPSMNLPEPVKPGTPAPVIPKHVLTWDDFLIPGLAGFWLLGAVILSGVVAVQVLRFNRKLARAMAPADPLWQELLDECRREFGVVRRIELLETDAVQSPALFGLFRLRLLVPRGFGGQFAGRELRYIFLHEIAHVKRGDLWLNWLVTVLQIVHWFNPLLWLGFARLRADRELACDELALLRAGDTAGTAYGQTVMKLLENLSRPAAIPGLVGILEDKKQMRRRISMIANFRRPGRWSALAVILIVALAAAALTDAQTQKPAADDAGPGSTPVSTRGESPVARPDLIGAVSAKGGVPLPVPASVFIAAAGPKTGTSVFCPSCYADCVKHAQTDAQGNFKIESLDPQLTFQILAVAKGYKPRYVSKVDPADGKPVKVELSPIESADAAPDRSLRGRVVDAKGKAIAGAVVEMMGVQRESGGVWGAVEGVDPLAVTDEKGEFLLTAKDPFDGMDVKVSARTFADKRFNNVPRDKSNELSLTEGAALTGRVMAGGRPLAGVTVGVSGADRISQNFLGHFKVGTGANGKFLLANLPPNADFFLYGVMDTMGEHGVIPVQRIHTGKDGETTDAGDLVAAPGHRLAGRVVLADGQPVPARTRLLVSRDSAWDSLQLTLDQDGNFDAMNVPDETVILSARVKGYHLSTQNKSFDPLNPFRLMGHVDREITNLVFLLEKGPDPRPDYGHGDPDYMELQNRPLRGAEGGPDHSRELMVSGRVLDAGTKEPVLSFQVTPGEADQFGRASWNTPHSLQCTNGVYVAYINKRASDPRLKVDADGYLPQAVNLTPQNASNVDFYLEKGAGPSGTVLNSDGKPAGGVSVVLLDGKDNRVGLWLRGKLTSFYDQSKVIKTDANGNFSFKPEWGIIAVATGSSNGFCVVDLKALATNPVIRLEPLGEITGTLKRTSGPGAHEDLDLEFGGGELVSSGINLNIHTVSDSQGRFKFEGVPPGRYQLSYREPMSQNGWQNMALKEVAVRPNESTEEKISTSDRPAKQASQNGWQQPPAKRIPGQEIKGVVLLPDGKPAADADVALQVEGQYLGIGKGRFSGGGRDDGRTISVSSDGSFTLPMFEKAESVVALNEEGFAQVSLEQLKALPQITLQKWGRIEGTLRVGHRAGTNEQVVLSQPSMLAYGIRHVPGQTNNPLNRPIYDFSAFKASTDDQGRFVIRYVPPGENTIARLVSIGAGSWSHSPLATIDVEPGETVVTNVGGGGRTISGRIKFDTNAPAKLEQAYLAISTHRPEYMNRLRQLKTDEERRAFAASAEAQAFRRSFHNFAAHIKSDGSFSAEEVLPGNYDVRFQPTGPPTFPPKAIAYFAMDQQLVVPAAKNADDDSPVDCGTIELVEHPVPVPEKSQTY